MNLEKLRADALAASKIDHNESPQWYEAAHIVNEGVYFRKNADHIANCDPATVLTLLAVVEAADNYYRRYAQDDAGEDGCEVTGCTLSQHEEAMQLRDALKALEAP